MMGRQAQTNTVSETSILEIIGRSRATDAIVILITGGALHSGFFRDELPSGDTQPKW